MHTRTASALLLAALCAACATSTEVSTIRADVHCVEHKSTVLIVKDQVHVVPLGGCRAWVVGPTPRQQADFARRTGTTRSVSN